MLHWIRIQAFFCFVFLRICCNLKLPDGFLYERLRHCASPLHFAVTTSAPLYGKWPSRDVRGLDTDIWDDRGNRCKLCSVKSFQTSVIFTFGRTDHSTRIGNDLDSITETRIQAKCKPPWLFIKVHTGTWPTSHFCLKYTMSKRLCPDGWSFLLSDKYACGF